MTLHAMSREILTHHLRALYLHSWVDKMKILQHATVDLLKRPVYRPDMVVDDGCVVVKWQKQSIST